ncbi:class F sortase [Modestobacter muralis]|uniref:Class F sortase n=1 Tax=Modestobacter muralis TaxID=1608614 RepID=A0A6P0H5W0_9ACTN|nr:class F sortase [Modestobacter muralis]NEK94272.1 class F sortase [Modestobacter muralis]NEN51160.1 class F sortase [Modestobacter muralis]
MPGRPQPCLRRRLAAAALALGLLSLAGCGDAATPAAAQVTASPVPATASVAPSTAVAAPLVMAAARPVRVRIPAIGVDSDLMDLGLQDDGTLEVPPDGFPAGWFTGAPTPGEQGPAVIAGHVDWAGAPGVFAALRDVAAGDEITVSRADGSTAVFRVTEVGQYDKDAFPTAAVYGDLDHAGLRVITCGGEFDDAAQSYLDNTVVFADLVASA